MNPTFFIKFINLKCKSQKELLTWLSRFVDSKSLRIEEDFKSGLVLLDFAETIAGVKYPRAQNPITKEQCHRNVTISFMAMCQIFEELNFNDHQITADGEKN